MLENRNVNYQPQAATKHLTINDQTLIFERSEQTNKLPNLFIY